MWRALRPILMPVLRELVGESAKIFLDPCCRVLFWQRRAIRRRLRGKRARWASWRYRVNLEACANLREGPCSAALTADLIVAQLIESGDMIVESLVAAKRHRLREVADLLGPAARRALKLPPNH